jgi:translation initiation factor 1
MSKRKPKERIHIHSADAPLTVNPFACLELCAPEVEQENAAAPAVSFSGGDCRVEGSRVVLRRETAHRGGKAVIIVGAFPDSVSDIEIGALARELRIRCGAGGTVRGREIEIQGDQASRIRAFFEGKGFRVGGEK